MDRPLMDAPANFVRICEEGPREGFQSEPAGIPTSDKIELIEALAESGLAEINCCSFVNSAQVPQMADAEAVIAGIRRRPGVQYTGLWLNLKGFERARGSAVDLKPTLVTSASETFGLRNNRQNRSQMLEGQRVLSRAYKAAGLASAAGYVFTAFGCNYEGATPIAQVVSSVRDLLELADESGMALEAVYLCDTIGSASPRGVKEAINAVRGQWPGLNVALHLHDTRGLGLANALVGLQMGVRRFDTSVGGLGGCPFAGNTAAAGNICTEDFVHLCQEEGFDTGIDLSRLIECGLIAERIVGRKLPGKITHAGSFGRRAAEGPRQNSVLTMPSPHTTRAKSPAMQPLKGMRVLDLSRVLAGPLCTQVLGTLGAEVIKVESIGQGDEMRQWPPMRAGTGAPFLAYNRNKKGLALDLKRPEARALVHRIAAVSDVFVESGSTGASERLGLGYEALSKIRPDLIYCAISGFGQVGPLRDAKGYDLMLQAFSGMMAMTGDAGAGPTRSAFSPVDQATGHQAVTGILSALLRRAQTGEGALVEVSLLETATSLLGYHLQNYWESGKLPERVGCGHPSLVPYQPFQTRDRPILIGVANDGLWRAFCSEFGVEHLAVDPRFATNPKRVENRAETVRIVQDLLKDQPADALIDRLIGRGVPCSPINTLADLSSHEQLTALGMILRYEHPHLGALKAIAQPITFDGRKEQVQAPPPMLGEHTREVLAMIGCADDEISGYLDSGVAYAGEPPSADRS